MAQPYYIPIGAPCSSSDLEGRSLMRMSCLGASDHPLGGLGFVNFMFELADQENELGMFFECVALSATLSE